MEEGSLSGELEISNGHGNAQESMPREEVIFWEWCTKHDTCRNKGHSSCSSSHGILFMSVTLFTTDRHSPEWLPSHADERLQVRLVSNHCRYDWVFLQCAGRFQLGGGFWLLPTFNLSIYYANQPPLPRLKKRSWYVRRSLSSAIPSTLALPLPLVSVRVCYRNVNYLTQTYYYSDLLIIFHRLIMQSSLNEAAVSIYVSVCPSVTCPCP